MYAHWVVHDVADDNNKDDTAVDDTMTRSETMLEDNVCPNFEDPLFHSMSVIDGSEKEKHRKINTWSPQIKKIYNSPHTTVYKFWIL